MHTNSLFAFTLAVLLASCTTDGSVADGAEATATTGGDTTTASTSPTVTSATEDTTGGVESTTAGTTGDATTEIESTEDTGADSSTGEAPGQPVHVAVGYGGMRVRSLDGGHTWQDYVQLAGNGGDDMNLLRGVAFGEGRFVAAGWRIFSSEDAVQWTEHTNPTGQWLGAVAYGNGMFLGVGGGGYCARSDDGMQWETCTDATDDAGFTHVRSTIFHDGLFWTADANGALRSSPDGGVWAFVQTIGSPHIGVVNGEIVVVPESTPAEFDEMRLRGSSNSIQRADAGSDAFSTVFAIPNGNNVFHGHRLAFTEGRIDR